MCFTLGFSNILLQPTELDVKFKNWIVCFTLGFSDILLQPTGLDVKFKYCE